MVWRSLATVSLEPFLLGDLLGVGADALVELVLQVGVASDQGNWARRG
jgi:hypothetical protein